MAKKKRTQGEGAVNKLSNGSWRAQLMDGYREDGKRNIISFTAKTKGEVLDKIRLYWAQKELGCVPKNGSVTFSHWADCWYEDYKTQVQASTYSSYQYTLRKLKDYFGDRILTDIKPMDINRFHNSLLSGDISKSYITKCRSMLIQIFDAAEANELIGYNPARKAKALTSHSYSVENISDVSAVSKDAFTDLEIDTLNRNLPDNITGHSILLMLGTGLRTQELLALTPSDIAEDGSAIAVNKAIKMVDGVPTLGVPKSKRSRRIIPVPYDYRKHALYLKKHSGKPYIWTSRRKDGLFDVGAFRGRYYRTLAKIPGVRKLSPHCCRHTYISILEKRGIPMEQIARLAGHTRISTTDGYLHTDMGTLSKAVNVLNHTN